MIFSRGNYIINRRKLQCGICNLECEIFLQQKIPRSFAGENFFVMTLSDPLSRKFLSQKFSSRLHTADIQSANADVNRVNNHARREFDRLANVALRLSNERGDVTAVTQNNFARNFQAAIFVVFEQMLHGYALQNFDEFPRLEEPFDNPINNFVVDNQFSVVAEHGTHD